MQQTDEQTALANTITIPEHLDPVTVLGAQDEVLRSLERSFSGIRVSVLGNKITVEGEAESVTLASDLVRTGFPSTFRAVFECANG